METTIFIPSDHEALRDKDKISMRPFSVYNSSESRLRELHAIVAATDSGAIGRGGGIPWHLPEDLKRFKALTMGHTVIMGRATWESLPKRPLPGRRNIVITSQTEYETPGAEKASSVEEAIAKCETGEKAYIIGGGRVYREAMPYCTTLHLTRVATDIPDADTFFPMPDATDWRLDEEEGPFESAKGLHYLYQTYRRK